MLELETDYSHTHLITFVVADKNTHREKRKTLDDLFKYTRAFASAYYTFDMLIP